MHCRMKHQAKIFKIYIITSKGKIKNYHLLLPNATGRNIYGIISKFITINDTAEDLGARIEKDITKRESYFIGKMKGKS